MTTAEKDLNRAEPEAEAERYAVGYGKPPLAHRFKKGNRANPGGRPKVKPSRSPLPQLPTGTLQEMLMLEANRMVRVKAGGQTMEIPGIQAAFRALTMRAAKGDRMAASKLAQLMLQADESRAAGTPAARKGMPTAKGMTVDIAAIIEAERKAIGQSPDRNAMRAAEEYREIWTRVLTEAAELEAEVAAPVPHPDDVAIGRVRGTVTWPGAKEGETLSLDGLAEMHSELQTRLAARRPAIEAMAEGYEKSVEWCEWFALEDVRALIAKHLPARHARHVLPDERPGEARLRDRSLRVLARDHRDRVEHMRAQDEAIELGTAPDGWPGTAGASDATPSRARQVVKIERDPSRIVLEATVYRKAWLEVLEMADRVGVSMALPDPHPDDVIIDEAASAVTYRAKLKTGERATLDNLRRALKRMKTVADRYNDDARWSSHERDAVLARRARNDMLKLCEIIERRLAGVGGEPGTN